MADASDLWNKFFQNRISAPHIELFECEKLKVKSFLRGRSKRRYLKRNPKMESMVREVCQNLIDSYHEGSSNIDGMVYCMYIIIDKKSVPLYIGKAEKIGRNGGLSANIKDGISKSGGLFARWGYGHSYHIGDLSAVIFDHQGKSTPKYEKWARELFSDFRKPLLKHKVYFWCEAWDNSLEGPWTEYGPTSLSFLEYQLIGLGSKINQNILNSEGTSFNPNTE